MAGLSPGQQYRATVTRTDGDYVYVEVPALGVQREFGPIQVSESLGIGDSVVVGTVAATEDLVITSVLTGGSYDGGSAESSEDEILDGGTP